MTLKYNPTNGNYVLFSDDVKKAQQVGFDLSMSVRGPQGEKVWFSMEPYAALAFWSEAEDSVKEHLSKLHDDYMLSQAKTSDSIYPAPDGLSYLPYQKAGIDYALRHKNCLIGDEMGLGKSQLLSVKILQDTLKGWTTMGELRVGSIIFGGDGKPCKVTAIYPQGIKPSYKVTFRDGTHTYCGADHLWTVKDRNRITRGKDWTVKTLQELMDWGITYPKKGDSKWQIPLVKPIQFSKKKLLIDPYILGVLIGDGYLGGSSIVFSNPDMDSDINKLVKRLLPIGYRLSEHKRADSNVCPTYGIAYDLTQKNPMMDYIKKLGLNIKSKYKFIPEIYKIASVDQRMELFKGLMDTDGSCRKNRTTYHTISTKLIKDIADLVRSLGGVAIVRGYDRSHENKPFEYQINVKTMFCPFHTKRKAAEWRVPAQAQSPKKFITKVEYVGDEEQQCIAVDSPDHLYVTDDYIVTHNTVEAIGVNNAARETKNLVICPASIRLNWQREIIKWSTIHNVTTYPVLKSLDGINPYANYTIISYNLCHNKDIHSALMDIEWDSMIFDEAHFLKTEDAKRTRAMFGGGRGPFSKNFLIQKTKRILTLTGTPLPNRPKECYTLAKALFWESIDWMSFDDFCYRFNPSGLMASGYNREEQGRLPELRARLRCNFMVRRLKKDVLKDLPSKRYEMSYIEPNGAIQKVLAKERLMEFDPYHMFDGNFELDGTPISTLRREMGEAKIPRVLERMKYLLDITEVPKIVLFSHHKTVMDTLAEELKHYGIVSHRGGMTPKAKQASIDTFIENPRIRIFSCQLDTAFGLDGLQRAASRLVFAEPAWTPGTNEQAVDRCHRIGQHDNVIAEFLITAGSFDELVLNAVLKKSKTIHMSLDQGCG